MSVTKILPEKNGNNRLTVKFILLILQILMPFGLYLLMKNDFLMGAYLVAGLFAISMMVVVWLG